MAILPIREYGDPVLREKAEPISEVGDEIRVLATDMIETMRDADGVGLAGPQVGVAKRIIVIHPPPETEKDDRGEPRVLINPEVKQRGGGLESAEEGCLSIPGVYEQVKRPRSVVVKALELTGESVEIEADEMLARILQHEIDHLDGVLFIDKIGPMRRALLKKTLRSFLES